MWQWSVVKAEEVEEEEEEAGGTVKARITLLMMNVGHLTSCQQDQEMFQVTGRP